MTLEKVTTLRNLLGELADELTTSECTIEKSRVVDSIIAIEDYVKGRSENDFV
jgi:hypothetical protein